jgi:hypothetical protein
VPRAAAALRWVAGDYGYAGNELDLHGYQYKQAAVRGEGSPMQSQAVTVADR